MAGRALNLVTLIGHTLGHYRILEEIGKGGMGVVYRAFDEHLNREIAIKVLPSGALEDERARKRFRKEARSLSQLNHPNIATIHDFDSQDGVDYLVMEYVPGKTLREIISQGPPPETQTIALAAELATGLGAAHQRGIVHRDLKPENVRLTLEGQVKILDFGLAEMIRSPAGFQTTETSISIIAGTLAYMAPEQVVGDTVDQRADVFSFGVVLYEMVTGQHPFAEVDRAQTTAAILHRDPVPPSTLNSRVPSELERIICKCVEKDRANRYKSATELATDLRQVSLGPRRTQSRAKPLGNRRLSRIAVGFAAALGLLFAALMIRGQRVNALTDSDTVVLADFVNSTSDHIFDDALNQALMVQLEQSPFLKIVPPTKISETLRLMGRSPQDALTPELAREVCQRAESKAVMWGSIATLGTEYVIGVTAAECDTGKPLVNEQTQSRNKEGILQALGKAASRLRRRLGESLSSVQKFDTPLEQATTPSLEALKAYSLGTKAQYQKGAAACVPFYKRAIELDPNFAVAYAALGISYSNLGETALANESLRRAYEMRDRVSEREKLRISAFYESYVKGDLVRGREMYELWAQTYPRDATPLGNLGTINFYMGQYQKAVDATLEHLRLNPDNALAYVNLIALYAALNRIDDAKRAYREALARNLEDFGLHGNYYGIAFLEGDRDEMQRQIAWASGKAGVEDVLLSFASDTEAFYGRLKQARVLSLRAIDSARRNDAKESAAGWQMNVALREVEFGNISEARRATSSALAETSTRDVRIIAALALARAGASGQAQQIAHQLETQFPRDTLINAYWLPTIYAAIELNARNPARAIELLRATVPYEVAEPYPLFQVGGSLYPIYIRAECYRVLRRGAEAAFEYQKILDHKGIVMNSPLGALARLGLARAYALQGDRTKARSAYLDFATLWKDSDSNISILHQANTEYARLQ